MIPLVVIDMQPEFEAANEPSVIKAVLREIRAAKKRHDPVIVLEYGTSSPSHERIQDALEGYPLGSFKTKFEDDGGYLVVETLNEHGWRPKEIQVCGVNIDYCVAQTVKSLVQSLPHVEIHLIEDACNGQDYGSSWKHIDRLSFEGKNVSRTNGPVLWKKGRKILVEDPILAA